MWSINVLFEIENFLSKVKHSGIIFLRSFRDGTRESPQFRLAKVSERRMQSECFKLRCAR